MPQIKLSDIPKNLLPVITDQGQSKLWLNGNIVKEIFIYRETSYRVNTNRGQFRYSLDNDIVLDIV